jgi:hypothetical protein
MQFTCSVALFVYVALPEHSAAQAPEHSTQPSLDRRLIGTWIQPGSGSSLEIRPDLQTVYLTFTGQPGVFNGRGAIEPCTTSGANICIKAERVNCSYRYSFSGGILNLQFKDGGPATACKAASGDFRKED